MSEILAFESIREGHRASCDYVITSQVFDHFLAAFEDTNPVHVSDAAAQARGFPERIMHGMILGGFLSHFIGVHFPGNDAVLQSVQLQFKSPCHIGDKITIDAKVVQVVDAVRVLALDLTLRNTSRDRVAAKAKIQVSVP